jgi:menaquinol-cytochrome c reductase iron-sulfur subunit
MPDDEALAGSTGPDRRRRLLLALSLGLGGGAFLLVAVPSVALLFWPLRRRELTGWQPAGAVDALEIGATSVVRVRADGLAWGGPSNETAFFVRRDGPRAWSAFSIYCTHAGCPVRWVEGAKLFLCPCHGGAFSREGAVVSGPPPRPLERLAVRVRDGIVEVRTRGVPLED